MKPLFNIRDMRNAVLLLAAGISQVCATPYQAHAGEFELKPNIAVSEEYTDNLFSTKVNTVEDYITSFQPGINANYKAAFWDWTLGYFLNYRYYAHGSRKDDTTHVLNANGIVTIIPDKIFLSLSDSYKRISLDTTRDFTLESDFKNQSDSNTAEISPYSIFHVGGLTEIRLQYVYRNLWYKEVPTSNSDKHVASINCSYELTPRLKATSNYSFEFSDGSGVEAGNIRNEILAGFVYEYASDAKLNASGGHSWLNYDNGHSSTAPVWNVGLAHAFETVSINASTSVRYIPDPLKGTKRDTTYSGSITKKFDRASTNLGLSYKEYVDEPSSTLEKVTYGVNFSTDSRLTDRLSGRLSASFTRFNDTIIDTYSNLLTTNLGFSYEVYSKIFVDFNYTFIDGYSPLLEEDTNTVNRFIVTVRATF